MRLVWHNSRLRVAICLIALAAVLLSSGLWMPMGIAFGIARRVPEWSRCGQTLCMCQPRVAPQKAAPKCPLCVVAPSDQAACDGCPSGTPVRMRLDLTPVKEMHDRTAFVFLGGCFMIGVLGTEAIVSLPPMHDAGSVSAHLLAEVDPLHPEIPTPPPRA